MTDDEANAVVFMVISDPLGMNPEGVDEMKKSQKRTESGGKPVEAGKEYKVRIIDRSERGEGVARIEGFIVFVRGAKPGEEVRIKVTNVGARAATGELIIETAAAAAPTEAAPATTETTPAPAETPPAA